MRRLPSLTSLRWFAALWVFVAHAPHVLVVDQEGAAADVINRIGAPGVSFFFVLSGFVLLWSHRQGDRPLRFYRRRVARIVPAYWAATLISAAVLALLYSVGLRSVAESLIPLSLVQAWVPHEDVYYSGVAVGWSLSVEAFFYAVFPLLVVVVAPLGRRHALVAATVVTAMTVALPAAVLASGARGDRAYWLVGVAPPVRLGEFVLGMLLAVLLSAGVRVPVGPALAAVVAVVASGLAGAAPDYLHIVAVTIVPVALLIAACAQADLDGRPLALLRSPWLLRLGQWSYAFYLLHIVALLVAERLLAGRDVALAPRLVILGAALAASIAASAALFRFVEYPLERRFRGAPGSATPESEIVDAEVGRARALI